MKDDKYIFFDVGANNGSTSIPISMKENSIVYAFEPTPFLINIIKEKISNKDNYILTEKAVANFNGKAVFKIAGQFDWGCSSLLNFSGDIKENWPADRTDFKVTEEIEVEVIRLEDFIEQHSIPKIDYLHVDTQGSDLNVLKGLGKYLHIVKEGVVEAASKSNILYDNQNTKEDTINFLEENDFIITHVANNDHLGNEVNIWFKHK
jgi:FkbM family methyltransferase